MNQGIMSKIKHWVSGDPYDDELYLVEDDMETRAPQPVETTQETRRRNLKVVEHPSSQLAQVVVIEPRAFEEALEIIDHLRVKKSVILNLHLLDMSQSQRVVDFLSGATHAIDGHQQRIGDGVFIFTPSNVLITAESEKSISLSTDAFWNQGR